MTGLGRPPRQQLWAPHHEPCRKEPKTATITARWFVEGSPERSGAFEDRVQLLTTIAEQPLNEKSTPLTYRLWLRVTADFGFPSFQIYLRFGQCGELREFETIHINDLHPSNI